MTTANSNDRSESPRLADVDQGLYHVFIRDLVVPCSIGIYEFEKEAPQPVRLNLDLAVHEASSPVNDEYENVVCYEKIANGAREIIARGHINLVETLAEDLAAMCLINKRVFSVRVRIEKLEIIADAGSVGVEIERRNSAD
jgi:7,8-dihydroneopterin aldolase/epimerase/oxygenase